MKEGTRGFTVVELLVSMAVAGVVMAGVYLTFYSQQKSYVTQTAVAAMQQNLRAAMHHLKHEIRMAGYDPEGTAEAGIVSALNDSIQVTMDLNGDGDTDDQDEDVTYRLYDADGDGIIDLGRQTPSGTEMAAENIDALDFVYLDSSGAQTADPDEIRSVQITVVARVRRADPGHSDSTQYVNQQGTVIYSAPGDGFRRDLLTAEVKCRNLGLE
ncbi:MAG: prepilin-type N-terminal cleavage/methylation domain-containing protein [Desulfobacteraceae bacterium]